MSQLNDVVLIQTESSSISPQEGQKLSEAEIIQMRVRQFCEIIKPTPVDDKGKINIIEASKMNRYYRVTEIQNVVCKILGIEKIWITGPMLLKNLRDRINVLERSGEGSHKKRSVFAITERGAQEIFELIENKKRKSHQPSESDINLPVRGVHITSKGNSFNSRGSEYS